MKKSDIIQKIIKLDEFNPVLVLLVGLPATGKSTFIKEFKNSGLTYNVSVASTDDYFQDYADRNGITYTEAFKIVPFSDAERNMWVETNSALHHHSLLLVDRTNMSVKSRSKFLNIVPEQYKRVAIVFKPPESVRKEFSDKRYGLTGKSVPSGAVESMRHAYEPPTNAEGFDEIFHVEYE